MSRMPFSTKVSSGGLTLFLPAYGENLRGAFQAMRPAIEVCSRKERPLQVISREVKFGMGVGMEAKAWIVQANGQALIRKVWPITPLITTNFYESSPLV
jgi:hypothetical protein